MLPDTSVLILPFVELKFVSPVALPPVTEILDDVRFVICPLTDVTSPINEPTKCVAATRCPDKLPITLPVRVPTTLLLNVGLVIKLFSVMPGLILRKPSIGGLGVNGLSPLSVASTKLPN